MSIASEITRLQNAKVDIKLSIENKGVDVDDNATLDDYADYIDDITTGITPTGIINITQNGVTDVTNYANANVNVPVPTPNLQDKQITITENGTTSVTADEGYTGLGEVEVTTNVPTSGPDLSEYFDNKIQSNTDKDNTFLSNNIKKLPNTTIIVSNNVSTLDGAFYNYKGSNMPNITGTSNVTSMNNMFYSCSNLTSIPLFDTSNVTNMQSMFYSCRNLTSIPLFNTSNVTNMSNMFQLCRNLTSIPSFDTSNVTNMNNMFGYCDYLESVPLLDCSKVKQMVLLLNTSNDMALTSLGGFKNLGQAYSTTASANYKNYTLTLTQRNKLTHESLMNVINNLYDIASKGVQPQQLVLGSTNLAKLTADEIAIATNKGWTVS